jgi:DNA-binding NarL/FixJ family response regulator
MCSRNVTTWKSPLHPQRAARRCAYRPFIARRVITEFQQQQAPTEPPAATDSDAVLSAREIDILNQVASGLTHREIAERMFISRHTVEAHVRNIYRKLAVSSRMRAVSEARARGLLTR